MRAAAAGPAAGVCGLAAVCNFAELTTRASSACHWACWARSSLALCAALLAGCAGPQVNDYAAEKPVLDMRQYFNGTAADVLGQAAGEEKGNAFRWGYTLKLPVDGPGDAGPPQGASAPSGGSVVREATSVGARRTVDVQFDDWMYLMNDKVLLNKAEMSKFGFKLGEVTLSFVKR